MFIKEEVWFYNALLYNGVLIYIFLLESFKVEMKKIPFFSDFKVFRYILSPGNYWNTLKEIEAFSIHDCNIIVFLLFSKRNQGLDF